VAGRDTNISDAVIMGDITTNVIQSIPNPSRVVCPQCQASGNITIFLCETAQCGANFCEHCKEEAFPRKCAKCIHQEVAKLMSDPGVREVLEIMNGFHEAGDKGVALPKVEEEETDAFQNKEEGRRLEVKTRKEVRGKDIAFAISLLFFTTVALHYFYASKTILDGWGSYGLFSVILVTSSLIGLILMSTIGINEGPKGGAKLITIGIASPIVGTFFTLNVISVNWITAGAYSDIGCIWAGITALLVWVFLTEEFGWG